MGNLFYVGCTPRGRDELLMIMNLFNSPLAALDSKDNLIIGQIINLTVRILTKMRINVKKDGIVRQNSRFRGVRNVH